MIDLSAKIRDVPDFPEPGIVFKDITPLLADAEALRETVRALAEWSGTRQPHLVLGAEARGFILGPAIACELGVGFVPARRPGKLPPETISASYGLEYGTAVLEVHKDAIHSGDRVLIVDDVLATGGTARATAHLVERLGGKVIGIACLIELGFLKGRHALAGYEFFSLITF